MFQQQAQPYVKKPQRFLEEAFHAAHRDIHQYRHAHGLPETPRTTIVACLIQHNTALWAHCGDSRLYLCATPNCSTRTRDHSYMEHRGPTLMLPERINRNVLFTCLGSPTKPVFDVAGPVMLQQGDKIMLCSDGLWGSVADEDIVRHLSRLPVSESVPELVETALRKAGDSSDNVTLIALEWETPDTFESTRGISTDSISDGVFASTIQSGALDNFDDDLDEATIERSIAEINEAIRRSAQRKH